MPTSDSSFPTRRQFATGAVASVSCLVLPPSRPAAQAAMPVEDGFLVLQPRAAFHRLRPEPAPTTPVWGYNGLVPGPLLRAKRGERLKVRLKNGLAQATSIHWHGIRIANAMDGAAGLTQKPVPAGENFDYEFVVPDAGTYWYHPHVHDHTAEQIERGLQGVLIVEEERPLDIDRDLLLVIDDWKLDATGRIDENFTAPADLVHAGRLGTVLTINAAPRPHVDSVSPNSRLRIRLVNTANARVFTLKLLGAAFKIVAVDGQPATPFEPKGGTVSIPPGGRFDFMVDAPGKSGESASILAALGPQDAPLLVVRTEGEPRPSRPPIAPLPPNNLPERIDLARARRFDLLMEGGVDPNDHGPNHMRVMMNAGSAWQFNKKAGDGHSGKPLFSVKRGTPVVLTIRNETAWPHAMHVHGHHFRTLFPFDDGWDPFWLDTSLVDARKVQRIAMVADNPGKWMIHCHMIEHQMAGMAGWFEVI